MARPRDPESPFKVGEHRSNGHVYATTQPYVIDKNGETVRRHFSWGTLINSKFIPNTNYLYASKEEREKLIFPSGWDLSAIAHEEKNQSALTFDLSDVNEYQDRFFGTTWLLGKIVDKLHVKEDLLATFHGDTDIVNDILTIAMFPYLTGYNLNRLEKWQELEKYPSGRTLSPQNITLLSQAITEQHRLRFLQARAARLEEDELLAVDSTTKSGWEDTLINIRWGKNKEGLPLEVTVEAVVYTLSSHQPVYYRVFPGNMHDSQTIRIILADLKEAGFKNVTLITDRGYDSQSNLEEYILSDQKMIMCIKAGSGYALEFIKSLPSYSFVPDGFDYCAEADLYFRQVSLSHTVYREDGTEKNSDRLRLNLYFDPVRRSMELKKIDAAQRGAHQELDSLILEKAAIADPEAFQKKHPYLHLEFETVPEKNWVEPHGEIIPIPAHTILKSYKCDDEAISRGKKTAGFFALLTLGKDLTAIEVLEQYKLRDEQEKYFSQMKTQMLCDRQRNSSEDGKAGRTFIQFIGLILSSYLRHIWKTTPLHEIFPTSLAILDEMRSIRCIEYPGQEAVKITSFTGKQLDICQHFGFELPKESTPAQESPAQGKKKRGRPPGSKNKRK